MYDKLMIVAHPDDESIFGGAQLIREKGWKVICLTNGGNRVRRKEFQKAMDYVEASWEIWDYKDHPNGGFPVSQLKRALKKELKKRRFEKIVTHGPAGEYGHSQHKALWRIVSRLVRKNLYTFDSHSEILDLPVLRKKLKLLRFYKSQEMDYLKHFIVYEGLRKVN